jgi:dephospho-CoA kinase
VLPGISINDLGIEALQRHSSESLEPRLQIDKNRVVTDGGPVVAGYNTSWPAQAAHALSSLHQPFAGFGERFEHIGSTAIPGMAAKDIVDLQISVVDLQGVEVSASAPLEALGFQRSPQVMDHLPSGTIDDPDNWSKLLWLRRNPGSTDINLHVRRSGSPNERLALLFRDWFRTHPSAVPAYASFKIALAGLCPDSEAYANAKDPVVDLVMVAAEEWARTVGWRVES